MVVHTKQQYTDHASSVVLLLGQKPQLWTHLVKPSSLFPIRDVAMFPGLLPIFLHGYEIKSQIGLGMRLLSKYFQLSLSTIRDQVLALSV